MACSSKRRRQTSRSTHGTIAEPSLTRPCGFTLHFNQPISCLFAPSSCIYAPHEANIRIRAYAVHGLRDLKPHVLPALRPTPRYWLCFPRPPVAPQTGEPAPPQSGQPIHLLRESGAEDEASPQPCPWSGRRSRGTIAREPWRELQDRSTTRSAPCLRAPWCGMRDMTVVGIDTDGARRSAMRPSRGAQTGSGDVGTEG